MEFYGLRARVAVLLTLLFFQVASVGAGPSQKQHPDSTERVQQLPIDEVVTGEAYDHIQRGNQMQLLRRYDEAIVEYEAALTKAGKPLFVAHMNLGGAYLQKQDYQSAIYHYRQAVVTRPNNTFARLHFADALLAAGNLAEAEAEYRKVIGIDSGPIIPSAHHSLGMALYRQRRVEEAIVQYELAIKKSFSDNPEAHYNLGVALLSKQSYSDAEREFRVAIKQRHMDWPDANFNLAVALERQKRFREAADAFETYLRQHPGAEDAATIRAKIDRLRKQP